MKRSWGALTLAVILLFAGTTAWAEQGRFFESLYDVPVMEGLKELPEQAMLFDKPDGRIASVVAASETLGAADIARFYGQTLPQMGWKKIKQNQYVREGEQLSMEITKRAPLTVVQFTLSPASP